MSVEIKVPSFGESVSEATVAQIMKQSGEYVEKDEEILELESDKVNAPVLAPESGILSLTVSVDDTVAIDQTIGTVDTSEAKPKQETKKSEPPKQEEKKQETPQPTSTTATNLPKARLNDEDFIKGMSAPKQTPPPSPQKTTTPVSGVSRRKMSSLRKTIATRLVQVKNETAMLTTFNEVDMSAIMKIRVEEKDAFIKKHDVKLGFMSFFIKACTSALKVFPDINSYIEGDEIISFEDANISVAVSTDKGLMVPVIKGAQNMTFAEIEKKIIEFSTKGREGKISMDDLKGGTFTITNGGIFGSMLSTPILNPPQSAILGMHSIQKRPVVVNDEIVIRPVMYLALSYDHRIVDGKEAVGFLVHVKEHLEDPSKLLLDF